jgi:hypothetical protein
MSQQDSEPRKPYSPPELEELGTVDEQTQAIVTGGDQAHPSEDRPGPRIRG